MSSSPSIREVTDLVQVIAEVDSATAEMPDLDGVGDRPMDVQHLDRARGPAGPHKASEVISAHPSPSIRLDRPNWSELSSNFTLRLSLIYRSDTWCGFEALW